jgi:hypothetical protein
MGIRSGLKHRTQEQEQRTRKTRVFFLGSARDSGTGQDSGTQEVGWRGAKEDQSQELRNQDGEEKTREYQTRTEQVGSLRFAMQT